MRGDIEAPNQEKKVCKTAALTYMYTDQELGGDRAKAKGRKVSRREGWTGASARGTVATAYVTAKPGIGRPVLASREVVRIVTAPWLTFA